MLIWTSASGGDGYLIAAFGARAAYDKLWCESNLLVFVGNFALVRFNFVKEQLGSPAANSEPGLTD